MAEFYSGYSKSYRLKLAVDQKSQSIENNTTTLQVRLYLTSGGGSFALYNCTAFIDGLPGGRVNWSGRPTVDPYKTILLIDRTVTISHADDGSKDITINARFDGSGGYSPGTMIATTGSYNLPKISRLSTGSASDVELGKTQVINIKSFNASYKHKVTAEFQGEKTVIAEIGRAHV